MMRSGLDTTPIIEIYGFHLGNGNTTYEDSAYGITQIYSYPKVNLQQTLVTGCVGDRMHVYVNGVYNDWWGWGGGVVDNPYFERTCINPNSNGIKLSIRIGLIPDAFACIKETGQILFAGKNTIYYGHQNISELT